MNPSGPKGPPGGNFPFFGNESAHQATQQAGFERPAKPLAPENSPASITQKAEHLYSNVEFKYQIVRDANGSAVQLRVEIRDLSDPAVMLPEWHPYEVELVDGQQSLINQQGRDNFAAGNIARRAAKIIVAKNRGEYQQPWGLLEVSKRGVSVDHSPASPFLDESFSGAGIDVDFLNSVRGSERFSAIGEKTLYSARILNGHNVLRSDVGGEVMCQFDKLLNGKQLKDPRMTVTVTIPHGVSSPADRLPAVFDGPRQGVPSAGNIPAITKPALRRPDGPHSGPRGAKFQPKKQSSRDVPKRNSLAHAPMADDLLLRPLYRASQPSELPQVDKVVNARPANTIQAADAQIQQALAQLDAVMARARALDNVNAASKRSRHKGSTFADVAGSILHLVRLSKTLQGHRANLRNCDLREVQQAIAAALQGAQRIEAELPNHEEAVRKRLVREWIEHSPALLVSFSPARSGALGWDTPLQDFSDMQRSQLATHGSGARVGETLWHHFENYVQNHYVFKAGTALPNFVNAGGPIRAAFAADEARLSSEFAEATVEFKTAMPSRIAAKKHIRHERIEQRRYSEARKKAASHRPASPRSVADDTAFVMGPATITTLRLSAAGSHGFPDANLAREVRALDLSEVVGENEAAIALRETLRTNNVNAGNAQATLVGLNKVLQQWSTISAAWPAERSQALLIAASNCVSATSMQAVDATTLNQCATQLADIVSKLDEPSVLLSESVAFAQFCAAQKLSPGSAGVSLAIAALLERCQTRAINNIGAQLRELCTDASNDEQFRAWASDPKQSAAQAAFVRGVLFCESVRHPSARRLLRSPAAAPCSMSGLSPNTDTGHFNFTARLGSAKLPLIYTPQGHIFVEPSENYLGARPTRESSAEEVLAFEQRLNECVPDAALRAQIATHVGYHDGSLRFILSLFGQGFQPVELWSHFDELDNEADGHPALRGSFARALLSGRTLEDALKHTPDFARELQNWLQQHLRNTEKQRTKDGKFRNTQALEDYMYFAKLALDIQARCGIEFLVEGQNIAAHWQDFVARHRAVNYTSKKNSGVQLNLRAHQLWTLVGSLTSGHPVTSEQVVEQVLVQRKLAAINTPQGSAAAASQQSARALASEATAQLQAAGATYYAAAVKILNGTLALGEDSAENQRVISESAKGELLRPLIEHYAKIGNDVLPGTEHRLLDADIWEDSGNGFMRVKGSKPAVEVSVISGDCYIGGQKLARLTPEFLAQECYTELFGEQVVGVSLIRDDAHVKQYLSHSGNFLFEQTGSNYLIYRFHEGNWQLYKTKRQIPPELVHVHARNDLRAFISSTGTWELTDKHRADVHYVVRDQKLIDRSDDGYVADLDAATQQEMRRFAGASVYVEQRRDRAKSENGSLRVYADARAQAPVLQLQRRDNELYLHGHFRLTAITPQNSVWLNNELGLSAEDTVLLFDDTTMHGQRLLALQQFGEVFYFDIDKRGTLTPKTRTAAIVYAEMMMQRGEHRRALTMVQTALAMNTDALSEKEIDALLRLSVYAVAGSSEYEHRKIQLYVACALFERQIAAGKFWSHDARKNIIESYLRDCLEAYQAANSGPHDDGELSVALNDLGRLIGVAKRNFPDLQVDGIPGVEVPAASDDVQAPLGRRANQQAQAAFARAAKRLDSDILAHLELSTLPTLGDEYANLLSRPEGARRRVDMTADSLAEQLLLDRDKLSPGERKALQKRAEDMNLALRLREASQSTRTLNAEQVANARARLAHRHKVLVRDVATLELQIADFLAEVPGLDKSKLIEMLLQDGELALTAEQREKAENLALFYLYACTELKHTEEVLQAETPEEFGRRLLMQRAYDLKELAAAGLTLHQRRDRLSFLVCEYYEGHRLRPEQVELLQGLLERDGAGSPKPRWQVRQLGTGYGKTSVVLYTAALRLADRKNLLMITMPQELVALTHRKLNQQLNGVATNVHVFDFALPYFRSFEEATPSELNDFLEYVKDREHHLLDIRARGHVIIGAHLWQRQLQTTYEKALLAPNAKEIARALRQLQDTIRACGLEAVDEADAVWDGDLDWNDPDVTRKPVQKVKTHIAHDVFSAALKVRELVQASGELQCSEAVYHEQYKAAVLEQLKQSPAFANLIETLPVAIRAQALVYLQCRSVQEFDKVYPGKYQNFINALESSPSAGEWAMFQRALNVYLPNAIRDTNRVGVSYGARAEGIHYAVPCDLPREPSSTGEHKELHVGIFNTFNLLLAQGIARADYPELIVRHLVQHPEHADALASQVDTTPLKRLAAYIVHERDHAEVSDLDEISEKLLERLKRGETHPDAQALWEPIVELRAKVPGCETDLLFIAKYVVLDEEMTVPTHMFTATRNTAFVDPARQIGITATMPREALPHAVRAMGDDRVRLDAALDYDLLQRAQKAENSTCIELPNVALGEAQKATAYLDHIIGRRKNPGANILVDSGALLGALPAEVVVQQIAARTRKHVVYQSAERPGVWLIRDAITGDVAVCDESETKRILGGDSAGNSNPNLENFFIYIDAPRSRGGDTLIAQHKDAQVLVTASPDMDIDALKQAIGRGRLGVTQSFALVVPAAYSQDLKQQWGGAELSNQRVIGHLYRASLAAAQQQSVDTLHLDVHDELKNVAREFLYQALDVRGVDTTIARNLIRSEVDSEDLWSSFGGLSEYRDARSKDEALRRIGLRALTTLQKMRENAAHLPVEKRKSVVDCVSAAEQKIHAMIALRQQDVHDGFMEGATALQGRAQAHANADAKANAHARAKAANQSHTIAAAQAEAAANIEMSDRKARCSPLQPRGKLEHKVARPEVIDAVRVNVRGHTTAIHEIDARDDAHLAWFAKQADVLKINNVRISDQWIDTVQAPEDGSVETLYARNRHFRLPLDHVYYLGGEFIVRTAEEAHAFMADAPAKKWDGKQNGSGWIDLQNLPPGLDVDSPLWIQLVKLKVFGGIATADEIEMSNIDQNLALDSRNRDGEVVVAGVCVGREQQIDLQCTAQFESAGIRLRSERNASVGNGEASKQAKNHQAVVPYVNEPKVRVKAADIESMWTDYGFEEQRMEQFATAIAAEKAAQVLAKDRRIGRQAVMAEIRNEMQRLREMQSIDDIFARLEKEKPISPAEALAKFLNDKKDEENSNAAKCIKALFKGLGSWFCENWGKKTELANGTSSVARPRTLPRFAAAERLEQWLEERPDLRQKWQSADRQLRNGNFTLNALEWQPFSEAGPDGKKKFVPPYAGRRGAHGSYADVLLSKLEVLVAYAEYTHQENTDASSTGVKSTRLEFIKIPESDVNKRQRNLKTVFENFFDIGTLPTESRRILENLKEAALAHYSNAVSEEAQRGSLRLGGRRSSSIVVRAQTDYWTWFEKVCEALNELPGRPGDQLRAQLPMRENISPSEIEHAIANFRASKLGKSANDAAELDPSVGIYATRILELDAKLAEVQRSHSPEQAGQWASPEMRAIAEHFDALSSVRDITMSGDRELLEAMMLEHQGILQDRLEQALNGAGLEFWFDQRFRDAVSAVTRLRSDGVEIDLQRMHQPLDHAIFEMKEVMLRVLQSITGDARHVGKSMPSLVKAVQHSPIAYLNEETQGAKMSVALVRSELEEARAAVTQFDVDASRAAGETQRVLSDAVESYWNRFNTGFV